MTWNWNNVSSIHHRWFANYLKRRGWVCFYLDERLRRCRGTMAQDGCWLQLYNDSETRVG